MQQGQNNTSNPSNPPYIPPHTVVPEPVIEPPPVPADIAEQHQSYDPATYFYKVRNDRSLENGTLSDVIARVSNWDVYDPTLAHYLAYCVSLQCDSLTTPAYSVAERLRWTPHVEYTEYDGVGLLMIHLDGNVILSFRTSESFEQVEHDLSRVHQTTDARLPARIAMAEKHRNALKKDPASQMPKLPRVEDEPLFEVGPDKIAVHSSISNKYQSRASETRSFVEEHLGAPMPILDSIRLMLAEKEKTRKADKNVPASLPPEFDGLSRYHSARPHIIVTGFGVGGAIAQLCALDMISLYGKAMVSCYTFGQCRLGNYTFCKLFSCLASKYYRVVNSFDPIPKLPKKILGLSHPDNSRVRYGYPPTLTREGYMHGMAPPSKRERLSLIKTKGLGLFRSDVEEMRLHINYCGIQIPMRLTPLEPFPFVVYRMVDEAPPQAKEKKMGRPPLRPELDLHQSQTVLPWDLILRDLAPAERTGMRHRLQVYSGSRQSPWSTYATPCEKDDEYNQQSHVGEPVVPGYTGAGSHEEPPLEQMPAMAHAPEGEGQGQKGRHVRFVAGEGETGIGAN